MCQSVFAANCTDWHHFGAEVGNNKTKLNSGNIIWLLFCKDATWSENINIYTPQYKDTVFVLLTLTHMYCLEHERVTCTV